MNDHYTAHLHWVIFFTPGLLLIAGLIIDVYRLYVGYVGLMLIGVGLILGVLNVLMYLTTSLSIANGRVRIQSGILVHNSLEIPFNKIESVDIRQSIIGSLLGYGTIMITGTGGSRHILTMLAEPLTCRRFLEQAMQS